MHNFEIGDRVRLCPLRGRRYLGLRFNPADLSEKGEVMDMDGGYILVKWDGQETYLTYHHLTLIHDETQDEALVDDWEDKSLTLHKLIPEEDLLDDLEEEAPDYQEYCSENTIDKTALLMLLNMGFVPRALDDLSGGMIDWFQVTLPTGTEITLSFEATLGYNGSKRKFSYDVTAYTPESSDEVPLLKTQDLDSVLKLLQALTGEA